MSTRTLSGTKAATDANIRNVFNKIKDDFWAIRTRGFESIDFDWLEETFEDILYVALKRELEVAELQFSSGGKNWIVRYELNDNGAIQRDNESGGVRFFSVAKDADLGVVLSRTIKTEETNDYLDDRGWGNSGKLKGEAGRQDRVFSEGTYGAIRKLTGEW